jgi:hypothetical protein
MSQTVIFDYSLTGVNSALAVEKELAEAEPESEETVASATLYQILRHGRETTKLGIFRNEIS